MVKLRFVGLTSLAVGSLLTLGGLAMFSAVRSTSLRGEGHVALTPQLLQSLDRHVMANFPCSTAPLGTLTPSERLVMWGDSLTDGTGLGAVHLKDNTALEVARRLLGDERKVHNQGLGGNLALAIVARAGAVHTEVRAPGGTIPAQPTPLPVTVWPALLDGAGPLQLPVKIAGISGTLSQQNPPRQAVFTRSVAGPIVHLPGSVPLELDRSFADGAVHIFWAGTNDALSSPETSLRSTQWALQAAARHFADSRYLLLNLQPGGYAVGSVPRQSRYADAVAAINRMMAQQHSAHTIDVFRLLTTYGGNRNGAVPAGLRADDIHLNAAGYYLVGSAVAQAIRCRGW